MAAASAQAGPEARLTPGEVLGNVPRIGVNLGGRSVWGAEQLMANVLRNPGLERALDGALVHVSRVDGPWVDDASRWSARPAGFWAGATFEVLSGAAAGQRGHVLDNRQPRATDPDRLTLSPMPAALRPGDVVALQGEQDPIPAPLWWTTGLVRSTADPRPGSPGRHALQLVATAGRPASLMHHLDSIGARAGKLLPVTGRWRLTLWVRGDGDGETRLRLRFARAGRPAWLDRTIRPGPHWQAVEIDVDALDDGPAGPLGLSLEATAGTVSVDDVALGPAGALQAGGFRTEVVQTLRALRPGYLRDWQGQLADTPANRVADPLARRPMRYRPGAHELQFGYALPEFLALAAEVGSRPWVILPATTTPEAARQFGAALRAGWQRHGFDEVVVEHGNEHWNTVFQAAGIADAATLAQVADRAFAALREGAGADLPLHRVIGTQYVNGAAAGRMARLSRHSEGVAVAPYFHRRQDRGEPVQAALDRALQEDVAALQPAVAGTRAQGRSLDVYEVNFHTTGGSATSAERDAVLASPQAGAALMRRLLQAMATGVRRQAVYSLAGYDSFIDGPSRQLVQLFGITRDLATAGHWRPGGAALQALNAVVGGTAQAVRCVGVACDELTAVAFGAGTRWAIVSSSAQPQALRWTCRSDLQLRSSSDVPPTAACVAGEARVMVPARAWLTAAPASAGR